ncbi:MAG: hypothetical protein KC731_34995 [Myxococcales bacterium]|nr:hypothetical protein [Myxococcales bacterium]
MVAARSDRVFAGGARRAAVAALASLLVACGGHEVTIPAGTIELSDRAPGEEGYGTITKLHLVVSCEKPVGALRRILDWQTISLACDDGLTIGGEAKKREGKIALEALGGGKFAIPETTIRWSDGDGSLCLWLGLGRERLHPFCSGSYAGSGKREIHPLDEVGWLTAQPIKVVRAGPKARWQAVAASERVAPAPPEGAISLCEQTVTADQTELDCRVATTDLSPLATLSGSRLEQLHVFGGFTDLSPLAGLGALRELTLGPREAVDLSALAGLAELETLILRKAKSLPAEPRWPKLRELRFSDTEVVDLGPVARLPALTKLYASDTGVADLAPLAEAKTLELLWVSGTKVHDLTPLAGLPHLAHLRAGKTAVSDLTPLASLPSLKQLFVYDTPVRDLSPLAGVKTLTLLNCQRTLVADLRPLMGATSLRRLDVEGSPVSEADLAALRQALPLLAKGAR